MEKKEFKKSPLKIEIMPQFFVNPPKIIRFVIKGFPSSGEGLPLFNRSIVERPNASLFYIKFPCLLPGNFNLSIVGIAIMSALRRRAN